MDEKKTYGYEHNSEPDTFDSNIWQGNQPTCAIRSQEIIMRDYGIIIPQDELIKYATQNGWFDPDPKHGGTPQDAIGNILDACGIPTIRTENANIYDIIAELRAGHRVIVSVDAKELWVKKEPTLLSREMGEFKNKVQDAFDKMNGVQGANHALIVAGVTVNPKDPSDIRVTLIDSGAGDVCVEYKLEDFQDALDDSNCYMVATTIPAPFQYNYKTHEMEPSSFKTNYYPSMTVLPSALSNNFHLDDSYYDKFNDFEPVHDVIDLPHHDNDLEDHTDEKDNTQYGADTDNDTNVVTHNIDEYPIENHNDNMNELNNDDDNNNNVLLEDLENNDENPLDDHYDNIEGEDGTDY